MSQVGSRDFDIRHQSGVYGDVVVSAQLLHVAGSRMPGAGDQCRTASEEMSRGLLLPWLQHPSKSDAELRAHVSIPR